MVRFKVVRGSHILLVLSVLVLAAVIAFIVLQGDSAETKAHPYAANEAKAISAFASNTSDPTLKIEVLKDMPLSPPLANAPSILIYHTHTHEAYEQKASAPYEALEDWRTMDEQHSVVRVGAALENELSKLGCFVMHDTTDHELDDIDRAYVRSLDTLESYSVDFDLIIDLHRDAYTEGLPVSLNDQAKSYAQIMLVVGNGGNYKGEEAPDYKGNLEFAQKLTAQLNKSKNGIARNVTIKNGRFNQHIGKRAVLIEVGHNRNTLEEALRSVPYLAKSIVDIL